MDPGFVSSSTGRLVRLALLFFAAVFGLVLLSLVFGSSPASADDGGSDDSSLVTVAAELVGGAVETVAPVAQAAAAIPLASLPLSSTVETVTESAPATTITAPVSGAVDGVFEKVIGHSLLAPVAEFVDTTVKALGATVAPVLDGIPGLVPRFVSASVDAATASIVTAGATAISGVAHGSWLGETAGPLGTGQLGVSSGALTTTFLPAVALGAAFFVLLFSRRLRLVNSALPVSPVYETDTSPD